MFKYVSINENGVNIRVRPHRVGGFIVDLLISIDGGDWQFCEIYPQIDAWGIWHDLTS